jgi:hypothetical protein
MHPSIRIEGAILAADVLDKIESGESRFQKPKDFGLDSGSVKDEIAVAWADARSYWKAYRRKLERLSPEATGTTETRNLWITPFLQLLGYRPEYAGKGEELNGRNYAISHRDHARDGYPIHVMGWRDELDRKRSESGGPRMSPHALVQEYLNLTEHLYSLVTNGRLLRLLRDSSRLVKLSFLEFDLERIFEEELFADFAILYRLLHVSRMPLSQDTVGESIIELYHQDSLDSGTRIRGGLSIAVERAIIELANGFLQHPANEELRGLIRDQRIDAPTLYRHLLRLVYRLLFLMVIEERDLVYPRDADPKQRNIYYDFYSLRRLRRLSENLRFAHKRHHDHWVSLLASFRLFEDGPAGQKLGLSPLAGDLFSIQAIGPLAGAMLDNATLLGCLRRFNQFQDPATRRLIRVNYAALDVEEFGSVYEGLLEYEAAFQETHSKITFEFVKGDDRSSSGSHYTPDELCHPLIKHSLDHIIADKLKEADPESALLSITVCDVACGSGHILLNAARRIGTKLAAVRTGEEQPSPSAFREAVRDVIRQCIYGVDLNPLAVELCKVAFWLEAHNPGEPLNFLDHRVKCGNAIVGLAREEDLEKGVPDEAFKSLPGDDKDIAASLRKNNKEERKVRESGRQEQMDFAPVVRRKMEEVLASWNAISELPESTPTEILEKKKRYQEFSKGEDAEELRLLASIPVAQFYLSKTSDHRHHFITDATFRNFLAGNSSPDQESLAQVKELADRKSFFHWFLEFPEVFARGGFNCILGNPPYKGGQGLSGSYGHTFCEWVRYAFAPTGLSDLVVYFIRRNEEILQAGGFFNFVTTNSIKDGDVRKDSLEQVLNQGSDIHFANRNVMWPGLANVCVSLIGIHKGKWSNQKWLDGKNAPTISAFLEDFEDAGPPRIVIENKDHVFQGSIFLGDGFLMSHEEADRLIVLDAKNKEVLFRIINGKELNNNPDQLPGRSIINFSSRTELQASEYLEPFRVVQELVKPVRAKDNMKSRREKWWMFGALASKLYEGIHGLPRCFAAAATTKYLNFSATPTDYVFSHALYVFTTDRWDLFTVVQSTIHEQWARKYSGSLKQDLRYSPSDCFNTFAFPGEIWDEPSSSLADTGENYHEHRKSLMVNLWLGLTKTYNLFHDSGISSEALDAFSDLPKDKAKKSPLTPLQKHLDKSEEATATMEEAVTGVENLRQLHVEMDEAVLAAYGWHEDTEEWGPAIDLRHDFYEVDYLPENDRVRYTLHPDARREILKRLLLLNHQRAGEEGNEGTSPKPKKSSPKAKKEDADQLTLLPESEPEPEPIPQQTKQLYLFHPSLGQQTNGPFADKAAIDQVLQEKALAPGQAQISTPGSTDWTPYAQYFS